MNSIQLESKNKQEMKKLENHCQLSMINCQLNKDKGKTCEAVRTGTNF
jgi:hypothetical protein